MGVKWCCTEVLIRTSPVSSNAEYLRPQDFTYIFSLGYPDQYQSLHHFVAIETGAYTLTGCDLTKMSWF